MPEQKVTVSGLYRPGWSEIPSVDRQLPFIPLAGPWLAEAGFYVGSQVRVWVERGRLVVTLRDFQDPDEER